MPPSVVVDTDVGELLYPAGCEVVTPEVQREGRWDAGDADAMRAALEPGMHVLNLGAHIGYFALLAASLVGPEGRVTAVEAAPANYQLLRANVRRARVRNVRLVHAAAWRASGTIELSLSPTNTGDHRAYPHAESIDRVAVPAVALDDLLEPDEPVDFVFADTQATEHLAIEGMSRTIARWRPAMLLEFWPPGIRELGDDPEAVLRTYLALDYELRLLDYDLGADATEHDVVAAAEREGTSGFSTLSLTPRGR